MLIAVFLLPFVTHADYVVDQTQYPVLTSTGNYISGEKYVGFQWTSTETVTQLDRVDVSVCQTGSPLPTGNVLLNVFNGTQLIASSSLAINSGNFADCGLYTAFATTTFVLNQSVQTTAGVSLFFRFEKQTSGGDLSKIQFLTTKNETNNNFLLSTTTGNTYVATDNWVSGYMYNSMFVTLRALGIPPRQYTASSTATVCGSFDVGCYISTSLTFLFIPSEETQAEWKALDDTLASTTPFGYVYEVPDIYSEILDSASTTPFQITINFGTMQESFWGKIGTTSVTVFDACWVNRPVGELSNNTYQNYIMPLFIFGLWIGLLWLMYNTAHALFSKTPTQ